jgi:hypothetical protein
MNVGNVGLGIIDIYDFVKSPLAGLSLLLKVVSEERTEPIISRLTPIEPAV